MSDKMHEEFKAWHEDQYGYFRLGVHHCQLRWEAWQASRAALVIELPNSECFGEYSQEAARVMRDGCADAISEAGLKYMVNS